MNGQPVIDLDYIEDFVGRHRRQFRHDRQGGIVEIQGNRRGRAFSRRAVRGADGPAKKGIQRLVNLQQMAVA